MSRFFGWGKLKLAAITEQLGDEESLAARLALPELPTAVVPDVRGTPPEIDLEATVRPWLRLPTVAYARALAALPPVAPRDWTPRSQGGISVLGKSGDTGYLELAGVDVNEMLELTERLGDRFARGDSGKPPR